MSRHAVAITGLGMIAPHGESPEAVFDAVLRGESAVRPVFPELGTPAAAATVDFDVTRWFTKLQLPGVDRVSQLAVAAAELAWADAGQPNDLDCTRLGVYVGCGMGGAGALNAAYAAGAQGGRLPPLTIPAFMPNAPAAHIAMRRKALGPALTYSVACASSSVALAEAAKAVQRGDVDVALAAGSEALIVPGVVAAWQAMHTLASPPEGAPGTGCRPFDAARSGFVLGEGAAVLVLERAEHARARGASVRALLAGSGISCDASHLTKPDAAGQARALRAALADADMAPGDVGYCNAHGTATQIGDVVEARALCEVWGSGIGDLAVSSTKAVHGHLLGAAGALEAALTVLALQRQQLPPNPHLSQVAPECEALNLVRLGQTSAPRLLAAMSSSFAFGGTNSVLVFRRP